jgi:hypothetical protein
MWALEPESPLGLPRRLPKLIGYLTANDIGQILETMGRHWADIGQISCRHWVDNGQTLGRQWTKIEVSKFPIRIRLSVFLM